VLLLLPFVFAALVWIAQWVTAGVERLQEVALDEVLGPARMWTFIGDVITLVLGGALVGGAYGRRRALGRGALQRLFAARPPTRDGGPASCRECGAPLAVAAGALGVRCAYCRADNLVAVDSAWLRGLAVDRKVVARRLHDAASAERGDQYRLRRSLGRRALVAAVAFAALFGWGLAWPGAWRAQVTAPPRTLTSSEQPPRIVLPLDGGARPLPLTNHCEAEGCGTALYVALRRGERLTLQHAGASADPLTVIIDGASIGHRFSTRVEVAKRALWRGQSIDFVAPHSGFFTVWLMTLGPLTIPVAATLR
jgi:LSD1 subclass zinc finger protein